MAGYKETPRQKMIGMMYLVLTALLALNVSVEILNSFVVVNESMETTNATLNSKTDLLYRQFEQANERDPAKVGPFWTKAQEVQKLSQGIKDYITQMKWEIIAKEDKKTIEEAKTLPLSQVEAKDKYDECTNYFFGMSQDGSGGKSSELKKKIDTYKQAVMDLLPENSRGKIRHGLDTKGPYKDKDGLTQNWEQHNFYHTILAANVVILNKLVADVSNLEVDAVMELQNSISAADFKIDQVDATIVPKSQYVFTGETFEADIFLTAKDTKSTFTANLGGRGLVSNMGIAKYTAVATTPGPVSLTGSVNVKAPDGELKSYPIKVEYMVAQPSATISATKMNVLYIGVDNPIEISAGGISKSQISAAITGGGSIAREGSDWVAKVSQLGKVSISASANLGGSSKSLGSREYRVKRVPPPVAYIANATGGPVSKEVLLASGAIIPKASQDFEFDVNFVVTSFYFSTNVAGDFKGEPVSGNRFNDKIRQIISNAKRGQKLMFEDIVATGPGGSQKLNSVVLTIQ